MDYAQNALNAEDVAQMLGVSKNTVYAMAKDGTLSSYNVGRKLRFTIEDVAAYIEYSRQRGAAAPSAAAPSATAPSSSSPSSPSAPAVPAATAAGTAPDALAWAPPTAGMGRRIARPAADAFLLGGADALTDAVASSLSQAGVFVTRSYQNSYQALCDIYFGLLDAAVISLWDSSTDKHNLPFVKRLLPGVPLRVYHLAICTQGLLVQRGNPLNLRSWIDVANSGAILANREKGSTSRVLLDEHLRMLEADPHAIPGYTRELPTELMQGSLIARRDADVGIGPEHVAHQIKGLDYLPLQKCQLVLVVAKRPATERASTPLRTLLRSDAFRQSLAATPGYNLALLGECIYEV